jgi:hypothetical protein
LPAAGDPESLVSHPWHGQPAPCHSSVVMISLGNSTSVRPRMVLHHQQSRRTIIQSVCPLAVLSPLINGNPAEFALFFQ